MKKIVVPTDFSACAENALKVAASIARKAKAAIHLVHVYEHPYLSFTNTQDDSINKARIHRQAEEEFDHLAAQPFMDGIKTTKTIFTDIKIWKAIKHKKFEDADLIIMGSHGISGWRELFIGSNTEKIVRYSEVPVLVIKDEYPDFEITEMVFASNFFSEADDSFFKIEEFFRLFSPRIHLLKIIMPGNFEPTHLSVNMMKDFARRFQLSNFTINTYNDRSVEEGVLNFCKSKGADLVAMETHGRTGFKHLINGSLTEKIVNHISMPVLSIKLNYKPLRSDWGIRKKEIEFNETMS